MLFNKTEPTKNIQFTQIQRDKCLQNVILVAKHLQPEVVALLRLLHDKKRNKII